MDALTREPVLAPPASRRRRWMVALLGSDVVPVEFGGKTAGDVTYGHRVLHGDAADKILLTARIAGA